MVDHGCTGLGGYWWRNSAAMKWSGNVSRFEHQLLGSTKSWPKLGRSSERRGVIRTRVNNPRKLAYVTLTRETPFLLVLKPVEVQPLEVYFAAVVAAVKHGTGKSSLNGGVKGKLIDFPLSCLITKGYRRI